VEFRERTNAGEFVRLKQQMDNQFNTLARSYHDNYIEYATTRGDSYRNGYESAQKGLEEIIASLTQQVTENAENIKLAVGKSGAAQYREKQELLNNIGAHIQRQSDRVEQGEMRVPAVSRGKTYTNEYFVVSLLFLAIVGLQFV
jgi:translation elongation factor EF-Ts